MDFIEFSKTIPVDKLMELFKSHFEEYILAYYVLQGVEFIKINDITINESSIIYSIELVKEEDRQRIVQLSNNIKLNIYGKELIPNVYIDGDLLYICVNL